ncbi:MAG: hypothetical protein JW861_12995 [Bacteroidales bacterium]|nr:hypothetical protein [Bacteroidales bacterium]
MKSGSIFLIAISLLMYLSGCQSCRDERYPRPRGYFRIDLPQKKYILFDSACPFRFEYPVYSRIVPDVHPIAEPFWINIEFPLFRGNLHLSYKPVRNNLAGYLEDTHEMAMKHIPKARAIRTENIAFNESRVFGTEYHILGKGVASPFQFFITDSTDHFIRGALYFNVRPNNDSLEPVIRFIKEDIRHILRTWQWKPKSR